jgi:menaquinone-dependent protoporphyrinogen oxidase
MARRILIVYGTTYGQTARIAHYIQDVLAAEGGEVVLEPADRWRADWNVHGYDAIIVGASLIVGRHQASVARFAAENRTALNRIPTAFFSVSASAAGTDPRAIAEVDRLINALLAEAQWHPRTVEKIGGAIAYTRYSFPVRMAMKFIAWRNGGPTDTSRDHELTDWAQVRQFALRVLALANATPAREPVVPG